MHALALDVGAGLFPQRERLGVVAEDDADLFQHRVGVLLDQRQPFLIEDLIDVDLALDIGELGARTAARARCPARRRATASAAPASAG